MERLITVFHGMEGNIFPLGTLDLELVIEDDIFKGQPFEPLNWPFSTPIHFPTLFPRFMYTWNNERRT
jgi:hypothetical protein